MKIIISPAKQMRIDLESGIECTLPDFINEAELISKKMQSMSYEELKLLWNCNDKIASANYQRIKNIELSANLTPAVLAYDGLQYTNIGARVFDYSQWQYISENLRILSGFYGLLKGNDGITPYRLEMQTKLQINESKNLYDFWGRKLAQKLFAEDDVILNLASKEYSKIIEKYVNKDIKFITCIFASGNKDNYKVKATEAKMVRGFMVRWCAEKKIDKIENIKNFTGFGYKFCSDISNMKQYVFLK